MKEDVINRIVLSMSGCLDRDQTEQLKMQLYIQLADYDVTEKETALTVYGGGNDMYIKRFLAAKAAAGKSERTIENYSCNLQQMLRFIGKNLPDITADDIRKYLYGCKRIKRVNKTTLRNMRAVASSFFGWCCKNELIPRNPVALVEPIKPDQTIKETFSEEDLVNMRDVCTDIRDLAMIDLLNASMIRVSELQQLDISDIDFAEKEFVVFGKGSKERVAYFNGAAKVHLLKYLETRTDDNPALFVSKHRVNGSYVRMSVAGIQDVLKRVGRLAGVTKVHPHRFRRTGATRNLTMGMPVEQVKELLGHEKIETTMIYAQVSKSLVKMNYHRLN